MAGIGGGRRGRDGSDEFFDTGGEFVDLAGQGVDLVQQHPGQFAVVVVEPAGERLDQGRVLDPHPAAGQVGELTWVTFAADQCFHHVAGGQGVQGAGHARYFDQRVFE